MKGTLKRILIIMLAVVTMMSTGGISTASMVYASDEVSLGTQSSSEQEVKAEAEKEALKEVTKEVPKETPKEKPKEVEKSSDESTKEDTGSADKQGALEDKAEESQAPDATEEKAENSTEATQEEEATENKDDSDEVDMPKQSFSATTSKGISVRASVSNDVFPADTKMKVKDVSDAEAMNIAEKTQDNVKSAIGVDITFYDAKGKEIQPKSGGVSVSISLPANLEGDDFAVTHRADGGAIEAVSAATTATGASFRGDSFSIYVVSGQDLIDEDGNSHALATYVFHDADGNKISTSEDRNGEQSVIDGDMLVAPTSPEKEGHKFLGWVVAGSMSEAQEKSPSDAIDFSEPVTVEESGVVNVYPLFNGAHYAFFMDGITDDANVAVTKSGTVDELINAGEVNLSNLDSEHKVTGWFYDRDLTSPVGTGDKFQDENIKLWPKVDNGHYVTFDTRGGNVINPQFVSVGGTVSQPADPARAGYTFGGWLDENNMSYIFGQTIDTDITLHARWIAKTNVSYSVIFWKQSVNDDKNASDANKTYDYASSERRTATTGATVSPLNADKTKGGGGSYVGFRYNLNKTTQSVEVAGDGTTVINVYYDRELMTINFYGETYIYTPTTSDYYSNQYGYVDGNYVLLTREWSWAGGYRYYYNGVRYTGTRYIRSTGTGIIDTFTGLYGQTLAQNNNTWPNDKSWGTPGNNGMILSFLDSFIYDTSDYEGSSGNTLNLYQHTLTNTVNINHYKQNLDGTYSLANSVIGTEGRYVVTNKYDGFNVTSYRAKAANSSDWTGWTNIGEGDEIPAYHGDMELRYERNENSLDFYNYNGNSRTETVKFGKSLVEYSGYVPPHPEDLDPGYTFQGWCKDKECTVPFDFASTMPTSGLIIYAKWAAPQITVEAWLTVDGGDSQPISAIYGQPLTNDMLPSIYVDGHEIIHGTSARIDVPADHEWVGWATKDENGNLILWNMNNVVTDNIELYPFYIDKTNYLVNYDVAGITDTKTYRQGSYADVKSADGVTAPDGKVFLHWADKDGKAYYPGDKLPIDPVKAVNKVITLKASYGNKVDTTELTYRSNYPAESGMTDVEKKQEINGSTDLSNYSKFALYSVEDAGMEVPEGYAFEGWMNEATGKTYSAGSEVAVNNKNNVMVAQWTTVVNVKLTADAKDGIYRGRTVPYVVNTFDTAMSSVSKGTMDVSDPSSVKITIDGATYTLTGLSVYGTGVDVGEYDVKITGTARVTDASGNDVTRRFRIELNDAELTISPKAVTLTSASDEKEYDGTPLTAKTVTAEGFVEGEGADFTVTGSQTNVGESDNTFDYVLKESTREENYTITKVVGRLKVTKATLTVTAVNYNKDYDGASHNGGGEASVTEGTSYKYKVEGSDDWTTDVPSIKNVGQVKYTIKAENPNYEDATAEGTLTVTPKAVTVTAKNKTKVYGNADPELTAEVEGTLDGDTVAYELSRTPGEDVGKYPITASGEAAQGNYEVTYVPGELEITKKAGVLKVEAKTESKVYDGADLAGGATVTGLSEAELEDVTVQYSIDGGQTWTNEAPKIKDVGEQGYTVRASHKNYEDATAEGTLTVTPRAVTVTAKNKTKVYGNADPELTAEVEGTLDGDTVTYELDRDPGEDVGKYPIIASGEAAQGNYEVTYKPGELEITKKAGVLKVEAKTESKVYDGEELVGDATVTGLSEAELEEVTVQYSVDGGAYWKAQAPRIKDVGEQGYIVRASHKNYEPTTAEGTLTVTPRAVTLTSGSAEKEYDGTPLTAKTVTAEGFVEGESADFTVTGSQTNVGESDNTFDYVLKDGTREQNYTITKVVGKLKVTKATLTVTAVDYNKDYDGTSHNGGGDANVTEGTSYKYSIDGGQTWTNEVPSIKNVGQVKYTVKAENPNYEDATAEGTLTVTPKAVTVTAKNKTKVYGNADPELTAKVDGTLGEDTVAYELSRTPGEDVGKYPITASGNAAQGNYEVTYKPGELEITKATLTVTAVNYNKDYDGTSHNGGGTASVTEGTSYKYKVEGSDDWTTDVPSIKNAGQVKYNVKAENPNYEDATAEGTLTVTPKAVTLTSASDEKEYDGTPLTAKTVTAEGFVEGEGADFTVTGSQTNVGESDNTFDYVLKDGTREQNYTITKVVGKLKVTKATLTVTAVNYNKDYDGASHNGGGTASVTEGTSYKYKVEGSDDWTTDVPSIKNVGQVKYTIKAENPNYEDATAEGTLAVTPKAVTVTAENRKKVYGNADPELTAKVDGTLGEDTVAYELSRTPGEEVGKYPITASGEAAQGNYAVTYKPGELEITKKAGVLKVEAKTESKVYDGEELVGDATVTWLDKKGLAAFAADDVVITYSIDGGKTWTADAPSIKDVGELKYTAKAESPNYETATDEGTLTVTPKAVTLTSGSAEKIYDGNPLTNDKVEAVGFVEGEGADYRVTGVQVEVGKSANTFEYTLKDNTKAENYDITVVEGVLEVKEEAIIPDESDDQQNSDDPKKSHKAKKTDEAVKTSDDTNVALYLMAMIASLLTSMVVFVRRRRMEYNQK